jgi:hypothetical protein
MSTLIGRYFSINHQPFFCLAHLLRWASAIFFLASGESFRFFVTATEVADAGGLPLRFELDDRYEGTGLLKVGNLSIYGSDNVACNHRDNIAKLSLVTNQSDRCGQRGALRDQAPFPFVTACQTG